MSDGLDRLIDTLNTVGLNARNVPHAELATKLDEIATRLAADVNITRDQAISALTACASAYMTTKTPGGYTRMRIPHPTTDTPEPDQYTRLYDSIGLALAKHDSENGDALRNLEERCGCGTCAAWRDIRNAYHTANDPHTPPTPPTTTEHHNTVDPDAAQHEPVPPTAGREPREPGAPFDFGVRTLRFAEHEPLSVQFAAQEAGPILSKMLAEQAKASDRDAARRTAVRALTDHLATLGNVDMWVVCEEGQPIAVVVDEECADMILAAINLRKRKA